MEKMGKKESNEKLSLQRLDMPEWTKYTMEKIDWDFKSTIDWKLFRGIQNQSDDLEQILDKNNISLSPTVWKSFTVNDGAYDELWKTFNTHDIKEIIEDTANSFTIFTENASYKLNIMTQNEYLSINYPEWTDLIIKKVKLNNGKESEFSEWWRIEFKFWDAVANKYRDNENVLNIPTVWKQFSTTNLKTSPLKKITQWEREWEYFLETQTSVYKISQKFNVDYYQNSVNSKIADILNV